MKVGLIGKKLGHSFSKLIHEKLCDYKYQLIELNEEEFHLFMEEKNFDAINVTIPYKEKVIPYLDEIDEKAKMIQAVNTVKNINGKLIGTNTDFDGLHQMITRNFDLKNEIVAICGSGGTSKTALAVIRTIGAQEIINVARNRAHPYISYEDLKKRKDVTYILNTTSVGMSPDLMSAIVDLDDFPNLKGVIDVVYNPLCTRLCYEAKKRGIAYISGLEMLVGQAIKAIHFFTNQKIDDDLVMTMTEEIYRSKQNLVLISKNPRMIENQAKKIANEYGLDYYFVHPENIDEVATLNHCLLNVIEIEDETILHLNGKVIKIEDFNKDIYEKVKECYDEIVNH